MTAKKKEPAWVDINRHEIKRMLEYALEAHAKEDWLGVADCVLGSVCSAMRLFRYTVETAKAKGEK